MKFKGRVTLLTTKMAEKWKKGIFKYCYLTFYPKTKYLLGLSGDYIYQIKITGTPHIISYLKVPESYARFLNEKKTIYKVPAKLEKIIPRKLGRKK